MIKEMNLRGCESSGEKVSTVGAARTETTVSEASAERTMLNFILSASLGKKDWVFDCCSGGKKNVDTDEEIMAEGGTPIYILVCCY
jgi:hypothetical protein